MNFMLSWQEQYLTRSLRCLVRYISCYSNIKFISSASRQRVISSLYIPDKLRYGKLEMMLCIYNLTWCMRLKTGKTTFRSIEICWYCLFETENCWKRNGNFRTTSITSFLVLSLILTAADHWLKYHFICIWLFIQYMYCCKDHYSIVRLLSVSYKQTVGLK